MYCVIDDPCTSVQNAKYKYCWACMFNIVTLRCARAYCSVVFSERSVIANDETIVNYSMFCIKRESTLQLKVVGTVKLKHEKSAKNMTIYR